jgi:hypothetical protein
LGGGSIFSFALFFAGGSIISVALLCV